GTTLGPTWRFGFVDGSTYAGQSGIGMLPDGSDPLMQSGPRDYRYTTWQSNGRERVEQSFSYLHTLKSTKRFVEVDPASGQGGWLTEETTHEYPGEDESGLPPTYDDRPPTYDLAARTTQRFWDRSGESRTS